MVWHAKMLLSLVGPLCLMAPALGQELPDLVGEWTLSGTGFPPSERCGEKSITATALVKRKVTARAYRGQLSLQETTERCGVIDAMQSDFTLRIRDSKVTIAYDEDGWETDRLFLDSGVMTGTDDNGITTTWVKLGVADVAIRSLTASEEQELDDLLAGLEPEFTAELRRLLGPRITNAIEKSGLDKKEARAMTNLTLERMSVCVVETINADVSAQAMPLRQVLASGNALVTVDPKKVDYQNMECIQAAALNAGVTIR